MILVGKMLYGYCNGFFGRDSYDNKRIEAAGTDWLVVRGENGKPDFATFENEDQLLSLVEEWSKPEEEDE